MDRFKGIASVEKRPFANALLVASIPPQFPDMASYRACISGCLGVKSKKPDTPTVESDVLYIATGGIEDAGVVLTLPIAFI